MWSHRLPRPPGGRLIASEAGGYGNGAAVTDSKHADIAERLGAEDPVLLDERGQKTVLRARHAGRDVAVKIVPIADGRSEPPAVILVRARREYGLLARSDHPNLVKVIGDLAEIGKPVHTLAWLEEFIEGRDFSELTGPQQDWDEVAAMARQVAGALAVLHREEVVHRDLSPGNVRRRDDGSFCVMDPGYARFMDRTTVTRLGQPGTEGYFSPEHLDELNGPQPASDIFTLGVLMYEALTGSLPWPVTAGADYGASLRSTSAPSIAATRPDLSIAQVRVIDTCLQRLAPRRFRDADHFLEHLEAAL
jgi:eukaryotic-like serine/threonine-protein kinase